MFRRGNIFSFVVQRRRMKWNYGVRLSKMDFLQIVLDLRVKHSIMLRFQIIYLNVYLLIKLFWCRLCCQCGTPTPPNPSNICVACIRSQVDITEGIQKQAYLQFCKGCERYRIFSNNHQLSFGFDDKIKGYPSNQF